MSKTKGFLNELFDKKPLTEEELRKETHKSWAQYRADKHWAGKAMVKRKKK